MARLRKYIICFSLSAIICGVLYGLFMSLIIGLGPGIEAGIIFGIKCSIGMAIIMIPIDYFFTRSLPPEAVNPRQNREIEINGNIDQIFTKCLEILKANEQLKTIIPLKDKMIISARTKSSIWSFGEDIQLHLKEKKRGEVEIHISSNPVVKTTMFDYGRNFKNVDKIDKAIHKISEGANNEIYM